MVFSKFAADCATITVLEQPSLLKETLPISNHPSSIPPKFISLACISLYLDI